MAEILTILIIDDSLDDQELYSRSLKKVMEASYSFLEAPDGHKGLEMVDDKLADCVLLDYSLPGMNGLEVLKNIRCRHPFLPVILLTGQGNEAVAVEAIKHGAHDYLTKSSVTPLRLHHAIKIAIEQGAMKQNIADIRLQMQEKTLELAASEERYDLVVRGMSAGLWSWEIEANSLYWSDRFKEIVGVIDNEFVPHHDEFAGRLHPDDKETTLAMLLGHLEGRNPYNVEYRLRHNDGHYIWIHAQGQAKWDADGKPIRMAGSVNDISERKKLEHERETMLARLLESNSELERFAYICSHDLQEPLRMISNFSQRLEKHLENILDEKGYHYLKYITDGAIQARNLINDVLNYARVDHETEHLVNIESEKILSGVLHDLNTRIEETGALITHDHLPEVYMQPTHLRQLLQNLIGNALKFCTQTPQIHISAQQEGLMWCFCVRDNGIGIPENNLYKIFSIFQRLHSHERYPGTGIGLALCKKLVQKYGGRIWVESETGQGSSFFFTLPPAIDQQSQAA